jgi:TonB-dependent SusC/RagA subfamily outer membrane receptor
MSQPPGFFVETTTGIISLDVARSSLLRRRIQLNFDAVPIREALDEIAAKAGIHLMYLDSIIPVAAIVRLRADGITVAAALTDVLDGTGVDVIFATTGSASLVRRPPRQAPAQGGVVSGTVKDSLGRGIAFANVFLESTHAGAASEADGSYRIANVPVGTYVLVVRRLGYRASQKDITVREGGTTTADFILEYLPTSLEATVVTGTPGGTQVKAVGNVVSTIDARAMLEASPVTNVQSLLGAQVAGMTVASNQGDIGTGGAIRIRGASTLGLSSEPLVYIDGVRMNSSFGGPGSDGGANMSRMNDINPEDIESIEVIKGPAAATLYGTEASAGVIQILTKRGKAGPPKWESTTGVGTSWFQNPAGSIGWSFGLDSLGHLDSLNLYQHEAKYGLGSVFHTGRTFNNSLQVNGGNALVRYFLSTNWDDQSGIVQQNWQRARSVRTNLSVMPRSDLTLSLNMSYVPSTTQKWQGGTDDVYRNLIWGGPSRVNTVTRGFARIAPEAFSNEQQILAGVNRFMVGFQGEYTPTSWLTQRLRIGLDLTNEDNSVLVTRDPLGANGPFGALSLGSLQLVEARYQVLSFDYSATAKTQLTRTISSETSVGVQFFQTIQNADSLSGTNFPAPGFATVSSAAVKTAAQAFLSNITVGSFINQQFGFRDRFFLTGAVRGDDNSSFGKDFKAAFYPKVSATWVVSEEPFWANLKKLDWINQLRFRSAWGEAGRQPAAFTAARLFGGVTGPGDQAGITPLSFGNPALKPERSAELEVGFDASFLNDRLQFGYTYFNKKTTDAIVPAPVAPSSGIPGTQVLNVGGLADWGHEFNLKVQVLNGRKVRWDVSSQWSLLHDRVTNLGALTDLPVGDSRADTHDRVGYPSESIFGLRILSATLSPTGTTTNQMCDGGTGKDGIQPGGKPVPCASAPLIYWGRGGNPTWEGTVVNTVTLFDNLTFQIEADGQGGNIIDDDDIAVAATTFNNTSLSNLHNNAVYQAYRQLGRAPIGFVNDGFVRLRSVSVTYNLPAAWARKLGGATRTNITVSGRNLLLLWQEQTHAILPDGSVVPDPLVRDPERRLVATEIATFEQAKMPPLHSLLMTIRIFY